MAPGGQAGRELYLEDIPLEDALARFWAALGRAGALEPLEGEPVPVLDALGRVTAEPVFARLSVPHYHAAAMDGIAVRAEDTLGASETSPRRLRVGPQATWVDTGDPLPTQTNAVIMAEQSRTWATASSKFWPRSHPGNTFGRWAKTWSQPSLSCQPTTP